MKKYKFSIIPMLCVFTMWGCADDPASGNAPEEGSENEVTLTDLVRIDLSRSEADVPQVGYDFALSFLRESSKSQTGENVLVSPFFMSNAWSMLANGARGETREKIIHALGFNNLEITDINGYFSKMYAALPEHDPSTNMQLANGFFQRVGAFDIKDDFISTLQEDFAADTMHVEPGEWFVKIDAWANEKTKGNIPTLLPDFSLQFIGDFAIADVLYFNGIWTNKFDKNDTKDGAFYNCDGTESTAQFMNKKAIVLVGHDDDSHITDLKFGNGAYSALFILPNKGINLDNYLTSLDSDKFINLKYNTKATNLNINLPKFETSCTGDWFSVLECCGLDGLRTGDYSGITDATVVMGYALQGCTFKIDEEGATASSAALVGNVYGNSSAPATPENMELTYDRPFIYILMENTTKTILMAGVINKM